MKQNYMNARGNIFKVFFLLGIISSVCCKRLLFLPAPLHSHVACFTSFAAELIQRGHEVHMVFNKEYNVPKFVIDAGVNIIRYECPKDIKLCGKIRESQAAIVQFALREQSLMALYKEASYMVREEVTSFLDNDELFTKLENLQFDMAIVDGFFIFRDFYLVPHRLGLPTISLSDSDIEAVLRFRLPLSPSYIPNQFVPFTENMNLYQRTVNYLLNWVLYFYKVTLPLPDNLIQKYKQYGDFDSNDELAQRTLSWLRTTDETLDYVRPTLPNTINVGGLTTKPAKPLSPIFKDYADKATNGLVVVSFGSMADTLPDGIATRFRKAFEKSKLKFVWRFKNPHGLTIPKNVLITDWLPQNDFLGHPNTKLFITHCGNNGQFEALYSGVPMIGFPLLGDQHYNGKRIEYKGFGINMDLFTFTADELVMNINKIVDDSTYSMQIKKASAIFRSRKLTPAERSADMIEHVLTFGGDHLRPYSLEMPLYQYLNLDVLGLILAIKIIICCIVFKCIRFTCRKCSRKEKTE